MLEEREKTQRNLDNKKGKSLHNAYDDEELLLGNSLGKKRSILSKYDEPLDGFAHKVFLIRSIFCSYTNNFLYDIERFQIKHRS
jgi:hypothetical protein